MLFFSFVGAAPSLGLHRNFLIGVWISAGEARRGPGSQLALH